MLKRAFAGKVISFIQLTVFFSVVLLEVERQTPTVLYTPSVALNWAYRGRIVKYMTNKL